MSTLQFQPVVYQVHNKKQSYLFRAAIPGLAFLILEGSSIVLLDEIDTLVFTTKV